MGKKYDARKMTELCDTLDHVVERYTAHAEMLENEYEEYNSNNTYRGEAADASKEFVYRGQGKLTKEQVRVLNRLSKKFKETQEYFSSSVDSSPNAKIDTDVIEYDKRYLERQKESFEEKAWQMERVTREMADKFERFGFLARVNADRARDGFEDMCGYNGFMNKCLRKFEEFDEEMTAHLKQTGLDRYMYDLETDTKATMNALDGMTVYKPDVKKITVTPIAQMAAKMMYSAGLIAGPSNKHVSLTEGEKLLKLLNLERSADMRVDANIIKTATNYAVQMCPSKEGTFAIKKCSTAMLAVDGQTLKIIAEIAAEFIAGAATLAVEIAGILGTIASGILIGAAIFLFLVIIYNVGKAISPLLESSDKEADTESKREAEGEAGSKSGENKDAGKVKSGKGSPPKTSDPDSIYEQRGEDGKVRKRSYYNEHGKQSKRQDYDHPHFDKKSGKYLEPHEHHYKYNPNGQPIGKDVGPITDGSTNEPMN